MRFYSPEIMQADEGFKWEIRSKDSDPISISEVKALKTVHSNYQP